MRGNVYQEPAKRIAVLADYDVVVVGGGPSGCSAALAAARHGARVLLLEKDGHLGGATVSQLVTNIWSTNGRDFQGIWHEYVGKLKELKGIDSRDVRFLDNNQRPRFYWNVNPEMVKYAWEELMVDQGVDVLFHSLFSDVIAEESGVQGVVVETKAGRRAVWAKCVIDCTGDAMVALKAGAGWEQGDGQSPYAMACTKVFRLGNAPADLGMLQQGEWPRRDELAVEQEVRDRFSLAIIVNGDLIPNMQRQNWARPLPHPRREVRVVASRVLNVDPSSPWDMSRAEREGRQQVKEISDFIVSYVPGYEQSYLLDSNNHLGVRSSRRLDGVQRVTGDDAINFRKYSDGIARASWDIDVWPHDSATKPAVNRDAPQYQARSRQLLSGEYFDIRYGSLVPKGVDNLLVAGRCISADHLAAASLRIQQTCMATGQAAGTAAALSLMQAVPPRDVDPRHLITVLEEDRAAVSGTVEVEEYIDFILAGGN